MSGSLAGMVVLVTGAGRGFGEGIARGLAAQGASVCVTDVNAAELQQTTDTIEQAGGDVLARVVDVRDLGALESTVAACVARWGRLDAVIANAAILPMVSFADTTPAQWQQILDINLTGVYNTFKAAWGQFIAQGGGHCIAIASGASVRGSRNEVAYCAAKHAIEGMNKALAMEAEPFNIAVNSVGPGTLIKPTSLDRAAATTASADQREQWADPATLAPAFAWLVRQPPTCYTGLRFDAASIADTISAEGDDFTFDPDKVTLYPADLRARLVERSRWTTLPDYDHVKEPHQ